MPWGDAAFAKARAQDRPILLAISAVWCHWCHVMDETTYSDPGVIETINRRYVPIRVDNDHRPDINARYNMGGWPTTAFLTPGGRTLTGATYLPPVQMRRALDEIARFYDEQKGEIAELTAPPATAAPPRQAERELDDAPIAALLEHLETSYDEEYGGFGDEPKFPQTEALEFLLLEWRHTRDPRLGEMVTRTLLAMARGGTYDHVEGGFFRYSTTRDWSVPHFEKMSEDHAGLLRALATLTIFAPNDEIRETLVSASNYVRTVLRDRQTGLYAGSQDADEAYYELPLEERRRTSEPFVDRTSYTNWTCGLASAQFHVARALDDDGLMAEACETLDAVSRLLADSDGVLFHVLVPGGEPQVRGLLTDHAAYLRALLDGHEITGERRFFDRALATAKAAERFAAPEGGYYDRLDEGEPFGNLVVRDRPIVDNGTIADSTLRLHAMTGNSRYRESAEGVLRLYAPTASRTGAFAASYARALARYLAPETVIRIAGDAARTDDFRESALRLPSPFTVVRTLTREEAVAEALPEQPWPAAYVCRGTTCGPPIAKAADLVIASAVEGRSGTSAS